MKSKILKMMWNRRKSNRFLLLEFIISFVVMFGICVVLTSLIQNYLKPLGFNYDDVWEIKLETRGGFQDREKYQQEEKQIFDRIEAMENVESLAILNFNSLFRFGYTKTKDFSFEDNKNVEPYIFGATDDFNKVFGLKLIEGRWFGEQDNASKYRPIVINKKLKQEIFGNTTAIGKVVKAMNYQQCVIVGVIDDFRYLGDFSKTRLCCFARRTDAPDLMYQMNIGNTSTWFGGYDSHYIKVKEGIGIAFEELLYSSLINRFPDWQITISPLKSVRKDYLMRVWVPVVIILLISIFLIFNVVLGLFGVLWYNISLRRSEIGLRMAIGASKSSIYKQFISEMLVLASLGILPGIIITMQFPILQIFNIETDIYIKAIAMAIILIYALVVICALLPSIQASKIQPAIALHEE